MTEHPLDLDEVQAFVRIAELGSFTRAAEAMQTTQAAISLKLRRLENRLGCRLIERTPRHVQLSERGRVFLDPARQLLAAHDHALAAFAGVRQRLIIGISDHVAGPELPALIARMNDHDPHLVVEIRIGSSGDLLQSYDRREIEAVIVRLHAGRSDGDLVTEEKFGWFASPNWQPRAGEPLPVATMAESCGVRAMAAQHLDAAGVSWTEIFVGGGVAAVVAAVTAGLGVAALAPRMLPSGAVDVGARLGLPELPRLPVLLHTRVREGRARAALDALVDAYRSAVQA
ncbi:MAG: LysR family transcriptional regulator [Bradyrhizobium sp.]|jgi:DNA-binding transcriptional LysR family regulator|uniref:LysR family transcriptional regulator n=4 Tax=Bradyrhizobium TaxID=374 RepID=A0ABS5G922_9BRAD|nr:MULTISPECIES: LysR family transcriptional regulator [Bradyrhizobium]RTL95078.1 MAG: LysR family transcriptional regulator [Bradyrhizobiaceae bacterium]ABQ37408.1 transcriptional regulator, LysR family [Bradyrhizobium sp. BTAi1]MBR1137529.1 LysR family transcriptional regulator [Bradyrhizobium denitrificans]MCL8486136.1 LysR family transcriptional regulator [Bradyrhizobium denitrificans]MDU1493409.1 LysR family transcriptional regulator [Bradyrhizobium sp.]